MARDFVCNSCGFIGKPTSVTPGSFGIELVLWLFICVPGLIYSIWRHSSVHNACPRCGSRALIPSDSPVAKQLLRGVRKCPFCAEDVQEAAIVCKHCGRDLPPPPEPPPAPVVPPGPDLREIRVASGTTRNIALGTVGVGFILTFLPSPGLVLGFLLLWAGAATLLVKGPWQARWVIGLVAALVLALPAAAVHGAREQRLAQRQAAQAAQQAKEAREAAETRRAELVKKATEEAARSFPETRPQLEKDITSVETLVKKQDWDRARQILNGVQARLGTLLQSAVAASSEVAVLKKRADQQQAALAAHDAAKQNAAARQPITPRGTSGNPGHDALMKLSGPGRSDMLSKLMTASAEDCHVTRNFFQGFDKSRNAYWNVACSNGKTLAVTIYNDSTGSTKILECSVLKIAANVECFKKF